VSAHADRRLLRHGANRRLRILFSIIFLISAALAIGISTRFLDIEGEQHGEYYSLILFATVGMMFIACGHDLISLYISLELMALTFYVLVAFTKREKKSNEAAMKYFLLGAFSSGVLLYGMSLIYGVAGSTNIGEIATSLSDIVPKIQADQNFAGLRPLLLLGMIALSAGLFFKVAAVPFHMWAPDVYEGAPTSVTAFLSTGSKAASFALYARIFSEAFPRCAPTGRRCSVSSPRSRSWSATGPPSHRKTRSVCSLTLQSPTLDICC
jgi:NADH-quinone oxidoreductase subunit N